MQQIFFSKNFLFELTPSHILPTSKKLRQKESFQNKIGFKRDARGPVWAHFFISLQPWIHFSFIACIIFPGEGEGDPISIGTFAAATSMTMGATRRISMAALRSLARSPRFSSAATLNLARSTIIDATDFYRYWIWENREFNGEVLREASLLMALLPLLLVIGPLG